MPSFAVRTLPAPMGTWDWEVRWLSTDDKVRDMQIKSILTVASIVAFLAGPAVAQSSSVGTAPGVPDTDTQSRITKPDEANRSDRGSRSEREARDDKGARGATGDQLGPPAGVSPDAQQVRSMLEKQGYSNIENL
jgi:hypothetical protein